jgi:predicted S18 family serine protease
MMDKPIDTDRFAKSPLIFLFLVAVLVVSTLVVASDYFLRPQIEAGLKNKNELTSKNTTQTQIIARKLNSQRNSNEPKKALGISQQIND